MVASVMMNFLARARPENDADVRDETVERSGVNMMEDEDTVRQDLVDEAADAESRFLDSEDVSGKTDVESTVVPVSSRDFEPTDEDEFVIAAIEAPEQPDAVSCLQEGECCVPKVPLADEVTDAELSRFFEGEELLVTYTSDQVVAAINAGGPSLPDTSFGVSFSEDRSFSGGDVLRTGEDIVDAQEPSLYRTARYGEVTYTVDGLANGDYYVDIHFAEIIFTNGPPGMRIFDVYIQEEKVVSELDVYERVGSNRPLILLNARTAVRDGVLAIYFRGVVGNPTISAICVHKAPPIANRVSEKSVILNDTIVEKCDERTLSLHDKSRHQQIRDKARGLVRDYEQRVEELKNECHEAWISVQDANRQAERLRDELSFKSLTVDTLANAVEAQVLELRDLKEKELNEKERLQKALLGVREEVEEMKTRFDLLAKEAKESICSFPDPRGMITAVQALVNEKQELEKKYLEESQERKYYYNKVMDLRGNVRVFCRCRPLSASEAGAAAVSVAEFDSAKENELVIRSGSNGKKLFKFDKVFTPEDDQSEVFADTSPVVVSVLDGYNVCIFAYGQTGTGKTFTMEGTPENRGVNYRTLEELFRIASLRKGEINYEISVSVLEVYNEQIRDLLLTAQLGQATKKSVTKLEIKQVAEGGHHVPGLVEAQVHSMNEVWEVLQSGSSARAVGSTNANEHSSRSHCMLCVKVKGENLRTGECTRSKLWLVDLAGSERVAKSDVHGERLKEAQNINKSLSALGDVIHALTTKSNHVPYRNSKLTHLLQDSLGGESKTLMFVQISPTEADMSETLCSLNFASRVRGVEMGPARKQLDSTEFLKYKQMAEKAKQEVKFKDDLVKKLEEKLRNTETDLRTTETKLKMKDQLCQSLIDKVRDRDKVAAELELQLATEKKARLTAEAALEDKRAKVDSKYANEGTWDRADAEEALEAAFKTAIHCRDEPRQPLQERPLENDLKRSGKAKGLNAENHEKQNENIDPQHLDEVESSALRKVSHGRMKVVASRFHSPPLMPSVPAKTGRASMCGAIRRTSLAPAPMKFTVGTPSFVITQPKLTEVREDINTVQDIVKAECQTNVALQVQDHNMPSVLGATPLTWKGVDVPGTLTRIRQHRRVHFSSPLMRSREKQIQAKKEVAADSTTDVKQTTSARMRRISLAGRSWSRHPGGAQRIPSGTRKTQMHQRERGWNRYQL